MAAEIPGIIFGGIDCAINAFNAYQDYKKNQRTERVTIKEWDFCIIHQRVHKWENRPAGYWCLYLTSSRIKFRIFIARAKANQNPAGLGANHQEDDHSAHFESMLPFLQHYCEPNSQNDDSRPIQHILAELQHKALGEDDLTVETCSFLVSYAMYLLKCDSIKVNDIWTLIESGSNSVRQKDVVLILPAASKADPGRDIVHDSSAMDIPNSVGAPGPAQAQPHWQNAFYTFQNNNVVSARARLFARVLKAYTTNPNDLQPAERVQAHEYV